MNADLADQADHADLLRMVRRFGARYRTAYCTKRTKTDNNRIVRILSEEGKAPEGADGAG